MHHRTGPLLPAPAPDVTHPANKRPRSTVSEVLYGQQALAMMGGQQLGPLALPLGGLVAGQVTTAGLMMQQPPHQLPSTMPPLYNPQPQSQPSFDVGVPPPTPLMTLQWQHQQQLQQLHQQGLQLQQLQQQQLQRMQLQQGLQQSDLFGQLVSPSQEQLQQLGWTSTEAAPATHHHQKRHQQQPQPSSPLLAQVMEAAKMAGPPQTTTNPQQTAPAQPSLAGQHDQGAATPHTSRESRLSGGVAAAQSSSKLLRVLASSDPTGAGAGAALQGAVGAPAGAAQVQQEQVCVAGMGGPHVQAQRAPAPAPSTSPTGSGKRPATSEIGRQQHHQQQQDVGGGHGATSGCDGVGRGGAVVSRQNSSGKEHHANPNKLPSSPKSRLRPSVFGATAGLLAMRHDTLMPDVNTSGRGGGTHNGAQQQQEQQEQQEGTGCNGTGKRRAAG